MKPFHPYPFPFPFGLPWAPFKPDLGHSLSPAQWLKAPQAEQLLVRFLSSIFLDPANFYLEWEPAIFWLLPWTLEQGFQHLLRSPQGTLAVHPANLHHHECRVVHILVAAQLIITHAFMIFSSCWFSSMVSSSCWWSLTNVILLFPLPLLFPFSIRLEKLEEEEGEEDWPETDLPWRRRGVPSRPNTWGAGFCSGKDTHRLSTMTSKRRSYAAPIRTSLWFSGLNLALSKTLFPLDSSTYMPPTEMSTEPKAFSARRYRFAKALTDSLLCLTNGFVVGHEFSRLIDRFRFVNPTSTALQCNQFQMLSWFYLQ